MTIILKQDHIRFDHDHFSDEYELNTEQSFFNNRDAANMHTLMWFG